MSTISNVEEAQQALCSGEFFQVGGELLDPDAIIQAKRDSGTPTFTLADGTTVKHDKYLHGDVGDLLFQALPSARRVGGQSEQIRPPISIDRLYSHDTNEQHRRHAKDTGAGSAASTLGGNNARAIIPHHQEYVLLNDDNASGAVERYSIADDDTLSVQESFSPGLSGSVRGYDGDAKHLIAVDNTPEVSVYDWQNDSSVLSAQTIDGDANSDVVLLGDGNGFVVVRTSTGVPYILQYDLNGSNTASTTLSSGAGFQQNGCLSVDRETQTIFAATQDGEIFALDYGLVEKWSISANTGTAIGDEPDVVLGLNGDRVGVYNRETGEFEVYNREDQSKIFGPIQPFNNTNGAARFSDPMVVGSSLVVAICGSEIVGVDMDGQTQFLNSFANSFNSVMATPQVPA